MEEWTDRSVPPQPVEPEIIDCSDVKAIHKIDAEVQMNTHGGYHYSSTAVEWYFLLNTMSDFRKNGMWRPKVSLHDGIRAVELGIAATSATGLASA